MVNYSASFAPVSGGDERHALDEVIYASQRTGELLEVVHDMAALRTRSAAEWRKLFDDRLASRAGPYASGVWSKHEWVQPHVTSRQIVSLGEGNTPLYPATRFGAEIGLDDLWIKQCGTSHTGSFKDLGMTVLVSSVRQMIANGKAIRAIACASTGDTSAALAAYGAAAGIPVVVLLPRDKVSAAQLVQPLANGALVGSLSTDFDGCMRVVQRLTEDPSIYLANSMNSLRVEGQKTIAIEIAQQFDWKSPDWVLVPGGNLGNVSAIAKGFREMHALGLIAQTPRIACCQAARANPLYRAYAKAKAAGRAMTEADYEAIAAGDTLASAIRIGHPVSLPKAVRAIVALDGVVEEASEEELADVAARADRTGLFTCPHTAVALAGLEKLRRSGTIREHERVVVIATAHGLKFTEFKAGYHEGKLTAGRRHMNEPVPMGSAPDEVLDEIHRALDRRAMAAR